MKILKKNDRSVSNSKTFVNAVEELAKDAGATLRIYEKSGLKGKYLAEIPIAEAVELARSFEESLKAQFGGGEYQVTFCNADSEVKARYSFEIAGPPKGRASDDEALGGRRAGTSDREMLTAVMGKLADAAISNKAGATDDFQRTLELAKTLKGEDGLTPKDLIELAQALQGQGGGGSEIVGAFMDGFQLRGEVAPQIEREDSTTTMLQAIMPLITGFIGRKQGIAPGAVDPALLQQVEQAVAHQLQGVSSGAPVAGSPPAPGGSHSRAAAPTQAPVSPDQTSSGLGGSVVTTHEQAPEAPSPPVAASHEYFQKRFLRPFLEDAADDQPAEDLAYQIVSMVQYARDRMQDDPPPILRGFLTAASPLDQNSALLEFFAAIPELAGLTQKCEQIRNALIVMFSGQNAAPVEEPEDFENVRDADPATIRDAEQADSALEGTHAQHETVSSPI